MCVSSQYINIIGISQKLVCTSLICGNKMPNTCNRWFLLQILLLAQHVSGTIMPIIRSSWVLYRWLLPVVFGALVFKLSVWCGAEGYVSGFRPKAPNTTGTSHLYNTLELLMMGIMVPETCWASNKICNKNHLLHLVGILFPHINRHFTADTPFMFCVSYIQPVSSKQRFENLYILPPHSMHSAEERHTETGPILPANLWRHKW